MLFSGIQHSHGIRAHKKWSISTASRSQFPIQRITQGRVSELVSASGTAAESSAGRNTIYKSEEATVNTKFFFSFLGKWQHRLPQKMRSDSNYDLVEVFKIITVGDDDNQTELSRTGGIKGQLNKRKILKEHKKKRSKAIEFFLKEKEGEKLMRPGWDKRLKF